jgi:hypothetical protein
MVRTSEKQVEALKQTVARLLDVPECAWMPPFPSPARINALELDHNITGFRLEQITNEHGGARDLCGRYSTHEMEIFLRGMVAALTFKKL